MMDFLWAFIIGGAFCAIAQILIDMTKLTPARILVLYVTLGVFFTAREYPNPRSGVVAPQPAKSTIGALTGGLTGAAGGIGAAIVFGYLITLVFKGRPRD